MISSSLRIRIATIVALLLALVTTVSGLWIYNRASADQLGLIDGDLRDAADRTAPIIQLGLEFGGGGYENLLDRFESAGLGSELFESAPPLRISGGDGVVPFEPFSEQSPSLPDEMGYRTVSLDGEPYRVFTVHLVDLLADEDSAAIDEDVVVEIGASLSGVDYTLDALGERLRFVTVVVVAVGAVAAWFLVGFGLRPLTRLRTAASRVASTEDLATRVSVQDGPQEIEEVGRALNEMLERLELSARRQHAVQEAAQGFARNLGHELRTPLTSMGANLETLERNPSLEQAMHDEILRDLLAEHERLVALLGALETLARGGIAHTEFNQSVDLLDVVDAAAFTVGRRFPEVVFEVLTDGEPFALRGWGEGLRVLVENLLVNASLHGRPVEGDPIVRVRVTFSVESAAIVVDDCGPGVPLDERSTVTEAFRRGSGAQGKGSGLGLALVAQQVELHEGTIEVGDSPEGGARFAVVLPRRDLPAEESTS